MIILQKPRTRVKPPGYYSVDWQHPLSAGLRVLYTSLYDSTAKQGPMVPTANASYGAGAFGHGFQTFGGNLDKFDVAPPSIAPFGSDNFTLEVLLSMTAAPSLSHIFGVTDSMPNSGTGGAVRGILAFGGVGSNDIYFWGGSNDLDSGIPWRTDGSLQHVFITFVKSGRTIFYRDGVVIASGASPSLNPAVATKITIGSRHTSGSAAPTMIVYKGAYYDFALSHAQIGALTQNPWVQLKVRRRVVKQGVAVAGAVTGTAADTLKALTESATGKTGAVGSAADNLKTLTASAAGFVVVNVTATGAGTIKALTEAATGITGARGTAADTLKALTASATGSVTVQGAVTGTAADTLQALTETATGKVGAIGTATDTLQPLTVIASGIAGATGIGASSLHALQGFATGISGAPPVEEPARGGAPAWWGYEGFDGTRRPWWYRDLKDKAAELERQRQIRIDLGILPKPAAAKLAKLAREADAFADEFPSPETADEYMAKADEYRERLAVVLDNLEEADDEQVIMKMSKFFFERTYQVCHRQ